MRTLRIVRAVLTTLWLVIVAAAAMSTWQAWRTRDFRPVPGAIISRGVSSTTQRSTSTRRSSQSNQRSQFLHLVYRYEVDGQSYDGNRIQAGTFGMASGDSLKKFGERFPEGQSVPVYVDPADPTNAVLVPGLSSVAKMLYAISGLVGFGVFLLRALTTPAKPRAGLP
jgi:hypothetical protein